ncbi:hypothetical protein LOTGIDRAFT_236047 [Lottia gigantea]|uniref:Calcium-responsive transcription factor n=1 Tax=Lottia gigantea TaxID=225164 RepID=V3ZL69_LOTGI|nr:hypothetical protein LOTGIDRAFT_236047 [Lottia gigantea]ESO85027.1 hypothetical protein LOTGIDRAFT_236047 [Lottia gigantea]
MTKDDEEAVNSSEMVMVGLPVVTYVTSPTQATQVLTPPTAYAERTDMLAESNPTDLTQTNLAAQAGGVLTAFTQNQIRSDHTTLQSLLATPLAGNHQALFNPLEQQIQIITVNNPSDLLAGGFTDASGRLLQALPTGPGINPEYATIIAVTDPAEYLQMKDGEVEGDEEMVEAINTVEHNGTELTNVVSSDSVASLLMPPPATPAPQVLPPDCPAWAARLKDCEKIGDSYRGYVESEVELDLLLTYHKQQTQSFWGTRQSPSPGSRAVVQECQYGPRRKGNCKTKGDSSDTRKFKQTCPARIYVKKVKKFPEYYVEFERLDKKSLKYAMDRAFQELKQRGFDQIGQERHYVQLPTEKAHQFHDEGPLASASCITIKPESGITSFPGEEESNMPESECNIHPKLASKIRELVSTGEVGVYNIRKQLRNFVTKDMYPGSGIPERHDWTLFPTVNNIKNHIHQALKDIENGTLALTATTVNVEIITNSDNNTVIGDTVGTGEPIIWPRVNGTPIPETVTVTLTQNTGEEGHHVISRIETHLSDGTTQVSNTITPETAQLLSRLHPGMFPAGSLIQTEAGLVTQQNGDILVGSTMVSDTDQTTIDSTQVDCLNTEPLQIVDDPMMDDNSDVHDEEDDDDDTKDHLTDTSMMIGTLAATCESGMDPLATAADL